MLLLYGSETVSPQWHVKETSPPAFCRVYYVRSGHVVYRDGHTVRLLRPGFLYLFPSTRPYEMEQDPLRPLDCLFLHIDIAPHLLSELTELSVPGDSFLFFLLRTMEALLSENTSEQSREKNNDAMNSLADTLAAYLSGRNLLQTIPANLAATIDYISEHVGEKISVDTLSGLCGYHTQYYIRLFCSYMGITPHQYVISCRMKLSLYALRTGKSVSETAECAGYTEVRNFTRAFKKYYGYSPSQVKKYRDFKI